MLPCTCPDCSVITPVHYSCKSLNFDRQHIFCTVCLHNLLLTISNRLPEFKECAAKRDFHVNEFQAHFNRQYSDNEMGVYEDTDTILINDSNTVHYSNDKEDLSLNLHRSSITNFNSNFNSILPALTPSRINSIHQTLNASKNLAISISPDTFKGNPISSAGNNSKSELFINTGDESFSISNEIINHGKCVTYN
ncbi:hypothetical protein GJ496_005579 [Pomphorhynchus laevis]|nr:hypothetical protein GJ496_005579 [Pomphorhynchus laevis]